MILLVFFTLLAAGWGASKFFSAVEFEKDSLYIQSGSRIWPVDVEIAKSKKEREQGLMYRRRLAENSGMLFLFPEPQIVSMWMKNTLIPLDMLFIDKHGSIVHIEHNVRPRLRKTFSYGEPVSAVLELPGGTAKKRMIDEGAYVFYSSFDHAGLKD